MVAFLLSSATTVFAQTEKITLSSDNMVVGQTLKEIEKQTGYIFAIRNAEFDTSKQVRFSSTSLGLDACLNQMLAGTDQTYQISGKHIVIVPQKKEWAAPAQAKPAPKVAPIIILDGELISFAETKPAPEPEEVVLEEPQPVVVDKAVEAPAPYVYRAADTTLYTFGHPFAIVNPAPAKGFDMAFKINMLYGAATLTPNFGVEFGLGQRTTLDIAGGYNPWNLNGKVGDNKKLVHWLVQPEFRYWFCERFNGQFIGAHALVSHYNVSGHKVPMMFDKQYRYQGMAYGAGVSYGYHLVLSRKFGLEFTAGVGVIAMNYDKYDCDKCAQKIGNFRKTYFGPTKAGITLVYMLK